MRTLVSPLVLEAQMAFDLHFIELRGYSSYYILESRSWWPRDLIPVTSFALV